MEYNHEKRHEKQEWYYLYHKFLAYNLFDSVPCPYPVSFVKDPSTDKEENRHAKRYKNVVVCHIHIVKTPNSDMGINY
jgi:hypothetical protein